MTIKIEDIIFWIVIIAVIGLLVWKLFGSPTDLATITTVASLLAMGELSLLKRIYNLEKRVAVGFTKVKSEINLIRNDIKHHSSYMDERFDNLEKLIKDKR